MLSFVRLNMIPQYLIKPWHSYWLHKNPGLNHSLTLDFGWSERENRTRPRVSNQTSLYYVSYYESVSWDIWAAYPASTFKLTHFFFKYGSKNIYSSVSLDFSFFLSVFLGNVSTTLLQQCFNNAWIVLAISYHHL